MNPERLRHREQQGFPETEWFIAVIMNSLSHSTTENKESWENKNDGSINNARQGKSELEMRELFTGPPAPSPVGTLSVHAQPAAPAGWHRGERSSQSLVFETRDDGENLSTDGEGVKKRWTPSAIHAVG